MIDNQQILQPNLSWCLRFQTDQQEVMGACGDCSNGSVQYVMLPTRVFDDGSQTCFLGGKKNDFPYRLSASRREVFTVLQCVSHSQRGRAGELWTPTGGILLLRFVTDSVFSASLSLFSNLVFDYRNGTKIMHQVKIGYFNLNLGNYN